MAWLKRKKAKKAMAVKENWRRNGISKKKAIYREGILKGGNIMGGHLYGPFVVPS